MKHIKNIKDFPKNFQYTDATCYKDNLYLMGYDLDSGNKIKFICNDLFGQKIVYGTPAANPASTMISYPTNTKLRPLSFNTIKDLNRFKKENKSTPLYGDYDIGKLFINTFYKDKDFNYKHELVNWGIIDIEVEIGADFPRPGNPVMPVTCITIYSSKSDKYYLLSTKPIADMDGFKQRISTDNDSSLHSKTPLKTITNWEFKHCNTEEEMMVKMLRIINITEELDIISGWNSERYDLPYIHQRLEILFGPGSGKALSPLAIGWIKPDDKGDLKVSLKGIAHIDYMKLYKNFTKKEKLETYRLDFVSAKEIGIGKIHYDGTLKTLWNNDPDLYMFYNLVDVHRIVQIEHKRLFMKLLATTCYDCRCHFTNIFSAVRQTEASIYQEILARGLYWDPKKRTDSFFGAFEDETDEDEKYPGGYVHQPEPGFSNWLVSFDVVSMYPHNFIKHYISPETLIEDKDLFDMLKDDSYALGIAKDMIAFRNTLPTTGDSDSIQLEWNKLLPMYQANRWDLKWLKNYNITMSPAIEFFRKDPNALMPKILKGWFEQRKATRKIETALKHEIAELKKASGSKDKINQLSLQMQNSYITQISLKYRLNSAYGATASVFFRNFDTRIAKSCTVAGRNSIYGIGQYINSKLNELLIKMKKEQGK